MKISHNINNKVLSAEIYGNGKPVLCLAGFGCSNYLFSDLKIELGKNFNCIMLDNPGTGESHAYDKEFTISDLAADAHKFMLASGFLEYHVVGISMGGFIAQELAVSHPNNVLSLSLMCTTSAGDSFIALPELSEDELKKFYSLPIKKSSEIGIRATVHPSFIETNKDRFEDLVNLRADHPCSIDTILKQKRAVDRFLKSDLNISSISLPTLILSGDKDRFVNPKNSIYLHEKIANSSLEFVKDSDHLFFFEKNDETSHILTVFLQNNKLTRGVTI